MVSEEKPHNTCEQRERVSVTCFNELTRLPLNLQSLKGPPWGKGRGNLIKKLV